MISGDSHGGNAPRSRPLRRRRAWRRPVPLCNKRCQLLVCTLVVPAFVLIALYLHNKASASSSLLAVGDPHLPSSGHSHSSEIILRTTSTGTLSSSIPSRNNNFVGEAECKAYGCPVYPGDVADETVQSQIEEVTHVFPHAGKLSLPFGTTRMAACTQRGTTAQHNFNQDRGILIAPYYWKGDARHHQRGVINTIDDESLSSSTTDFLIGIFDGHGDEGHHISRYLQKDMAERLSGKLSQLSAEDIESGSAVLQSLKESFIESDANIPEAHAMNGGSTASVILRLGQKIYFANVGDSTTFLASYNRHTGETKVVHRNRKDKPHLLDERARIEASGGKVRAPPDHPIQARVIAYNSVRKELVGLAMSRSIGDWDHGKVGVIAEPTVDMFDLDDVLRGDNDGGGDKMAEAFVVVGSDGLFDARQPQFVANHLSKSYFGKETDVTGLLGGDRDHPVVQCSKLIGIATPKDPSRYRDDITLLSLRL